MSVTSILVVSLSLPCRQSQLVVDPRNPEGTVEARVPCVGRIPPPSRDCEGPVILRLTTGFRDPIKQVDDGPKVSVPGLKQARNKIIN